MSEKQYEDYLNLLIADVAKHNIPELRRIDSRPVAEKAAILAGVYRVLDAESIVAGSKSSILPLGKTFKDSLITSAQESWLNYKVSTRDLTIEALVAPVKSTHELLQESFQLGQSGESGDRDEDAVAWGDEDDSVDSVYSDAQEDLRHESVIETSADTDDDALSGYSDDEGEDDDAPSVSGADFLSAMGGFGLTDPVEEEEVDLTPEEDIPWGDDGIPAIEPRDTSDIDPFAGWASSTVSPSEEIVADDIDPFAGWASSDDLADNEEEAGEAEEVADAAPVEVADPFAGWASSDDIEPEAPAAPVEVADPFAGWASSDDVEVAEPVASVVPDPFAGLASTDDEPEAKDGAEGPSLGDPSLVGFEQVENSAHVVEGDNVPSTLSPEVQGTQGFPVGGSGYPGGQLPDYAPEGPPFAQGGQDGVLPLEPAGDSTSTEDLIVDGIRKVSSLFTRSRKG